VPDQVHPLRAAGIDERAHVVKQFGHAVIPATRWPCAAGIAPLVGGQAAIPVGGELRDDAVPGRIELREAM
jgi:hypothetical protein